MISTLFRRTMDYEWYLFAACIIALLFTIIACLCVIEHARSNRLLRQTAPPTYDDIIQI